MTRGKKGYASSKGGNNGGQMSFIRKGPRRPTGNWDWIVGGRSVDSTGSPIAITVGYTTWNLLGTLADCTLASNSFRTFQAALIQPAPATSTPGIGRLGIDQILGSITVIPILNVTLYDYLDIAVGIYVADLNNTTSLWEIRDPTSSVDAGRDDWLYLEAQSLNVQCASTAANTFVTPGVCFDLNVRPNVVLGSGQAIHVVVGLRTTNGCAVSVQTAFRTRIGPVA